MNPVYLIILGYALKVNDKKDVIDKETNPILVARLEAASFIAEKFLSDNGKSLKDDAKLVFSGRGS